MKNLHFFVLKRLFPFFFASLLFCEFSNAQFNDDALFVVADAEAMNTAETKIDSLLEEMGFYVTVIGQDSVTDEATDGMSIVLISATVTSGTVATNMPGLADMAIPLINWEPFLYDHLGHSELDGGEYNTTEIIIEGEGHQLAAGLPNGYVTITTMEKAVSYGAPEGDAEIIAVSALDETQVVLFGYEEGAEMFTGNAPARRVGTFLLNDVADAMTEEGWALVIASINWAMNYVDPTAVEEFTPDRSSGIVLYDNYPNPFTEETQIKFSIPVQTNVQLTVYNVLGEKVATLVDENKPDGDHVVTFDASELYGGVYYYNLLGGSHTISKSMVLIK
jgi:hypothetical protein